METSRFVLEKGIVGCVIGTAVGDAIGLPCEGLSRRRIHALFGGVPTGHRLLFGRGMVSDDTEHTLLVADALVASAGNPDRFEQTLAGGLRRWICQFPAGVGLATLRACLRLLIGIPSTRSGVFSAGNGPAMRSALIGVFCGIDKGRLRELIHRATRLTHTDPRAEYGALAVALAASAFASDETEAAIVLATITTMLPEGASADELHTLLRQISDSLAVGETTHGFATERLGLKGYVSGYVYQTVPVALHAALSHPNDFRAAIRSAIDCGGDTDTIAAIVGGIVGAHVGIAGIPLEWRNGLIEWPQDIRMMEQKALALTEVAASNTPQKSHSIPLIATFLRNILFLGAVLYHGLRRLLPSY